MAPKKKAKSENGAKVTDSGEDGGHAAGEAETRSAETEPSIESAAATDNNQQPTVIMSAGPEAPKLDLAGLETFEYAPDKEMSGLKNGALILCEIQAKDLTTENIGVKERRVWGTDTYTDSSDLVAIAAHAGVFNPTAEVPKFSGLVMVVRVTEAMAVYTASQRNNLRSRSLTGPEHSGLSLRVQGSAVFRSADERAKLTHVVQRPPRLQRFSIKSHNAFSDARVVFNLSNEPAFKYSLSMVADRSPDARHWTSVRLQTSTLYLESTGGRRFELSLESHVPGISVTYRFAECKKPRTTSKSAMQEFGVPLPESEATVLEKGLSWNEIEWGVSAVRLRGKLLNLNCCFWLSVTNPPSAADAKE